MKSGSFAAWSKATTEVRLLPSHRNQEMGTVSFLITFQRDGTQVTEKDSPVLWNRQEALKKSYI